MKNDPAKIDELMTPKGNHVLKVRVDRNVIKETDISWTAEVFAQRVVQDGHLIATGRDDEGRLTFKRPGSEKEHAGSIKEIDGVPILKLFSTACGLPANEGITPSKYLCFKAKGKCDSAALNEWANETREAERAAKGGTGSASTDPKKPRFQFTDSTAFMTGDYRQEYLIDRVLVRGQPGGIVGPAKGMKTSLMVDMAVSIASATPFLGMFRVRKPATVAIMSRESGAFTLQETARRIGKAKDVNVGELAKRLIWSFDAPIFSNLAEMQELAKEFQDRGIEVVFLDPLYLMLGQVDAKNLFEMGDVLRNVADLMINVGITPNILHHANRQLNKGGPMELDEIAYSGVEQFLRQYVLMNRREKYKHDGEHKLWVSIGGSAGHGGLYGMDISEGLTDENFCERKWNLTIVNAAELSEKKDGQKEENTRRDLAAKRTRMLEVIDEFAKDKKPATLRSLRPATGWGHDAIKTAIESLLTDRTIVPQEMVLSGVNNNRQVVTGYIRTPTKTETPPLHFGDGGNGGLEAVLEARTTVVPAIGVNGGLGSLPVRGEPTTVPPLPAKRSKSNPSKKKRTRTTVQRGAA